MNTEENNITCEKRPAEDIQENERKKQKASTEEIPKLALEKVDQIFPAKTFKERINEVLVQRLLDKWYFACGQGR